jgi:hypothetical protein
VVSVSVLTTAGGVIVLVAVAVAGSGVIVLVMVTVPETVLAVTVCTLSAPSGSLTLRETVGGRARLTDVVTEVVVDVTTESADVLIVMVELV